MLGSLWLIPILCLAGAIVNLLLGAIRAPKPLVTVVGVGSVGAATVAAYAALIEYLRQPYSEIIERYFTWISAGEITVNASLQLDPLSAVMMAFVTFVGFLIHVYSVGYMHQETDEGYARYFAYLNLFMFAMLLLVLGSNLPVLFVGWEGVGLCSYLLIGYYYEKEWCAAAGSKAFIVNRIGDLGFLLAIFATIAVFGSVEFNEIFASAASHPSEYAGAATIIALLLFVGAIGKSAQIPLYVWLPDAMAGPTPVSALIHAATMVTAGSTLSPAATSSSAQPDRDAGGWIIGGVTALFAATIGLVQNDIKKVLAYSTVSQLGYMFLAAGVGALSRRYFTSSPTPFSRPACSSVPVRSSTPIRRAGNDQDGWLRNTCRRPIGLLSRRPWRSPASRFSPASFRRTRFWPNICRRRSDLNGFGDIYRILWYLAVGGALLTAFYMFRAVYMTFHGEFRGEKETEQHLHESPRSMTVPLIILGCCQPSAASWVSPDSSSTDRVEPDRGVPPPDHASDRRATRRRRRAPGSRHQLEPSVAGRIVGSGGRHRLLVARRFYAGDAFQCRNASPAFALVHAAVPQILDRRALRRCWSNHPFFDLFVASRR